MKNDFNAKNMCKLALAYNAQHSLENKEFQTVKEEIIAAANQGRYSLNLTLDYDTTIKTLQALGFRVCYSVDVSIASDKVPKYYEVCWNGYK